MKQALVNFFQQYSHALSHYDIFLMKNCYQLPCSLSTPDKLLLLCDENVEQELEQIFSLLKSGKTSAIKASNCSYQEITPSLFLVNIDWQFLTKNNNLFTEFTALYHIAIIGGELKVVSVVSQEMGQGLTLKYELNFK